MCPADGQRQTLEYGNEMGRSKEPQYKSDEKIHSKIYKSNYLLMMLRQSSTENDEVFQDECVASSGGEAKMQAWEGNKQ